MDIERTDQDLEELGKTSTEEEQDDEEEEISDWTPEKFSESHQNTAIET